MSRHQEQVVQDEPREPSKIEREVIEVDHLSEDKPIYGQQFFLMSFAGPNQPQKADMLAFKFRGAYRTKEAASAAAKNIRKEDPHFDILVGDTGLWLPFFPDPESIAAKEYQESKLNDLVADSKQEVERNRDIFADRKREMLERAKFEGSREGQKMLAERKEHWMSVKYRQQNLEEQIRNLQEKLDETERIAESYTEEERKEAEEEYKREQEGKETLVKTE